MRETREWNDSGTTQVLTIANDFNARKSEKSVLAVSSLASAQSEVHLPRAILADTMFSILEYKPISQELRCENTVRTNPHTCTIISE